MAAPDLDAAVKAAEAYAGEPVAGVNVLAQPPSAHFTQAGPRDVLDYAQAITSRSQGNELLRRVARAPADDGRVDSERGPPAGGAVERRTRPRDRGAAGAEPGSELRLTGARVHRRDGVGRAAPRRGEGLPRRARSGEHQLPPL